MRVAFFELEGWEKEEILREFPDAYLSSEKLDPDRVPERTDFEALSVFVGSRLDRAVLAKFPDLKFVATRSTGFDHIDLAACAERGISVTYVPGYGDNTVAEFAFGLLLALTRKIYAGIDQIKESGSFALANLRGVDLHGRTLGVVGTGRIGRHMIKIAQGFEMKVLAYDPFPDLALASTAGFEYVSLTDLLRNSDVVSLHCPYSEKTRHILNSENMPLIKKGAYLLNTARGGLVETDALVAALRDGTLAAAALDVLEEEGETKEELELLAKHPKEEELRTVLENHILMHMPNVLITPHNAFNSEEALRTILRTTFANLHGFETGQPVNLVPAASRI